MTMANLFFLDRGVLSGSVNGKCLTDRREGITGFHSLYLTPVLGSIQLHYAISSDTHNK